MTDRVASKYSTEHNSLRNEDALRPSHLIVFHWIVAKIDDHGMKTDLKPHAKRDQISFRGPNWTAVTEGVLPGGTDATLAITYDENRVLSSYSGPLGATAKSGISP
jgi:hypothetical protein